MKGPESEFLTTRKRDGLLGGQQREIGKEWEVAFATGADDVNQTLPQHR